MTYTNTLCLISISNLKTGRFETRRFETWRFVNLTFCKPDVLKPDVLKPDILKPDVLKPDVLWVYQSANGFRQNYIEVNLVLKDLKKMSPTTARQLAFSSALYFWVAKTNKKQITGECSTSKHIWYYIQESSRLFLCKMAIDSQHNFMTCGAMLSFFP